MKKTGANQAEVEHDEPAIGLDIALGLAVKRLREYRSMTQVVLAEKANVSQTWVSLAENAEKSKRNKRPSLGTLQRIAFALGLPGLTELIKFAEQMTDFEKTKHDIEEFIAKAE